MRTLFWKLALILVSGTIIEWKGLESGPWFFWLGCVSIPVVLLAYGISRKFSMTSWLPAKPAVLSAIPVFFIVLSFVFPALPEPPPESWFQFDRDEPDYEHRFLVKAQIQSSISPGLFLSRMRIQDFQKDRDPSYYGEDWKSISGQFPKTNISNSAGSSEYKFGWLPDGLLHSRQSGKNPQEGSAFRSALAIDNEELYPGCILSLQVYGRGVPQKPYGGFGEYLRSKGANSYLRVYEKWHVLDQDCPNHARQRIRTRLFKILSELEGESAEVGRAIMLGESGWLNAKLEKRVRRLGVMHLFAASGLHLGIFYGIIYWPLSLKLGRKHPLALFLPLLPCALYAWVLYFPVSLCRAFIFILLLALRSLIHRKITTSHHLANTALVLILWDPPGFYSLSGYLSFGAVSGILLFYRAIEQNLFVARNLLARAFRSQLALSLSATMFIAPLLVFSFLEFPFSSHLSNIVMVPFVALMLPPLYLVVALRMVPALDGRLLQAFFEWVTVPLEWFIWLARSLGNWSLFFRYESWANFAFVFSWLTMLLLACSLSRKRWLSQLSVRLVLALILVAPILSLFMDGVFWGVAAGPAAELQEHWNTLLTDAQRIH